MSDLTQFLEELDLEDYVEDFIRLGVKKLKHLEDVEEKHLVAMNMRELEIKRFKQKQKQTFTEQQAASKPVGPKLTVPLPSPVFGHSVQDFSEDNLRKTYSEIYYISPMNLKQKQTNSFILKMCSAAEWR